MRVLRALAPLVLVAGLATACGHDSSSSPAATSDGPAVSSTVQLRPVSARYTQDPSKGEEQFGPQAPQALLDTMKNYDCTSQPTELQGMLLACGPSRTVYLLESPLITGGVASAVPRPIEHGTQWYVRLTFGQQAAATLSQAVDTMSGNELAVVLNGQVLTALVVDPSMKDGHVGITGDYDKAGATKLARELTA